MAFSPNSSLLKEERALVLKIQGYFSSPRPFNCVGFHCAPIVNGHPIDGVHFSTFDGSVKTTVCLHTGSCDPLEEVTYFLFKLLATKKLPVSSWGSLFPSREHPGNVCFSEQTRSGCAGFSFLKHGEDNTLILKAGVHYDAGTRNPFTEKCSHKGICDPLMGKKYALMQACISLGGFLIDETIDAYHFILMRGWLELINRSGLAWKDFMLTPERWPQYSSNINVPGWMLWHPSTLFTQPSVEQPVEASTSREVDLSMSIQVKDFCGVKMLNLEQTGWNSRRLFFSFNMARESPRLIIHLAELWKSEGFPKVQLQEPLNLALAALN